MFASGVVKLTYMDKTWWDLSALNWHYESQVRRESEGTTVHPVHLLNTFGWRPSEGGGAQNHTLLRASRLKNHAFINSHIFQYAPTNVHLGTI